MAGITLPLALDYSIVGRSFFALDRERHNDSHRQKRLAFPVVFDSEMVFVAEKKYDPTE